jgi:hypothetical protein
MMADQGNTLRHDLDAEIAGLKTTIAKISDTIQKMAQASQFGAMPRRSGSCSDSLGR